MRSVALVLLCLLALGAVTSHAAPPTPGENFTLTEPTRLTMIWIPPGTFLMAHPLGAGDDTWVTLTRGYWLGRTEVTQAQWQAVATQMPVFENTPFPSLFRGSERPVEQITWEMAVAFCTKLTELERAAGRLPEGYEYTLPTEAQWEYACRAGDTANRPSDISAVAWYGANSGHATHAVALKLPNAWGLYDMHGNVAEWCADWLAPYPGDRVNDPTGPASGVYRVMRGTSYMDPPSLAQAGLRNFSLSYVGRPARGFRLALAPVRLPPAPKATTP